MATTLVYTIPAYVPFTKILSANINSDKLDIQNRLNWSGGTDATTGLSGDNIQSNTCTAETKATLVTQGITFTANTGFGSNGNNITVTFTSGAIAGSEVISVSGTAITIQVAAGVSTVTQVVAAVTGSAAAQNLVSASGSSSSTVTSASVLSLSGGVTSTGLVRSTKLALDTANYVLINDNTGKMSSEAQLSTTRGGTGVNITPTNLGDVLQVVAGPKLGLSAAPTAPQSRILSFYRFS